MVAIFTPQPELQERAHTNSTFTLLPAAQFGGPVKYEGPLHVRIDPTTRAISMEPLDDTWANIGIAENALFAVEFGGRSVHGCWFLRTVVAGERRNVDPADPSPEILNSLPWAVSSDPIYPNRLRGVRDQVVQVRLSDSVFFNTNNHRARGGGVTAASDNLRQLTFAGAVSGLWRVGAGILGASSGAVGTVVGLSPGITQGGVGHFVIVDVGVDYAGAEFTLGEVVDSTGGASGTLRADELGARSISPLFRPQRVGQTPNLLDYRTLVLADMGLSAGTFLEMQDSATSPLTDSGPNGLTDWEPDGNSYTTGVQGPFGLARAIRSDTDWDYNSNSIQGPGGPSAGLTWETWFKSSMTPGTEAGLMYIEGPPGAMDELLINTSDQIEVLFQSQVFPDPGAWAGTTVYAQGARVRPTVDNNRVYEAEVGGTSAGVEPTFPTDGSTVVDGTVTWRDVGPRIDFHNAALVSTTTIVPGEWFYAAVTRDAAGKFNLYVNGQLEDSLAVPAANTVPGSFGLPVPRQFDTADYSGDDWYSGNDGLDADFFAGDMAYQATHYSGLTPAQVKAHYDLGVALGLN